MKSPLIIAFIFSILAEAILCYLQFRLVRIPYHTKVYNFGVVQCMSDLPKKTHINEDDQRRILAIKKQTQDSVEDESSNKDKQETQKEIQQIENKQVSNSDDFKQICYEKDISYAIELSNNKEELLYLSMDMTIPISWIKGDKCFIAQTHRQCSRIEINFKDQMKSLKKLKALLKNPFKKQQKKKSKGTTNENEYALIEGSSEVVKGILQKAQNLQFALEDSGRLTRFLDVVLMGLGILNQKSNLKFQNTTFITATQISPALNYLCDGAISLRFDQNSQSSFLKQMAAFSQENASFVTIFVGQNNQSLTIGDLSVKNSAQGLSGVNWVSVEQDDLHGKLPKCQTIQFTQSNSQSHKQIPAKLPIVLTLSASYISIPSDYINKMFEKFFKKSTCHIEEQSRFVVCEKMSKSDIETKELSFQINQTSIMIPFKALILQSKSHQIKFNIKSSLDERYIILGEPVFQKYFIVLDYQNNRIGISLQRQKFASPLISVIVLIRFVIWAFICGCCCICFAVPCQKCYSIFSNRYMTKSSSRKKSGRINEETKKIIPYRPIQQQNPYEDIKGKIQQIITQQVEGI